MRGRRPGTAAGSGCGCCGLSPGQQGEGRCTSPPASWLPPRCSGLGRSGGARGSAVPTRRKLAGKGSGPMTWRDGRVIGPLSGVEVLDDDQRGRDHEGDRDCASDDGRSDGGGRCGCDCEPHRGAQVARRRWSRRAPARTRRSSTFMTDSSPPRWPRHYPTGGGTGPVTLALHRANRQPKSSAVSASVRSSTNLNTTTARCRRG